jgi:hypothetical protein
MSKNEFDELLLKKLQEEELEYNQEHWEHLSQLLPPSLAPAANKGRKWFIATGIAAAAAFILAAVFYAKLMDKNKDAFPVQEPVLAKNKAEEAQSPATQNLVHTPSVTTQQNVPAPSLHNNQTPVITGNSSQANLKQPAVNPVTQPPVVPQHIIPEQQPKQETVAHQTPEEKAPVPPSPWNDKKENTNTVAHNKTERNSFPVYPNNFDNRQSGFTGAGSKNNRTSVSVGGGVNYGNLNTGYTVGVSARTKIAGNFFVDGAVAMMYNNNANNVVNYNGGANTVAKSFARPGGQLPASPSVEPTQNLYYVQVNPSIGYQIDRNIAMSVGSDFQQMLSRTDGAEKVQLAADNAKIFPAFDVGLTTKSEFNITPNIQAGLMYREGLSNLLKNDGNQYVNRRYFQVQFKYNIPVN